MTVVDLQRVPSSAPQTNGKVVNNFSFVVATANGTGSQTSNNTLIRTLFKMGIPVNGKNLFPSNIKGEPTWYYMRLSKDGYLAHRPVAEVLVAFNERTFAQDVAKLPPGGVLIYPIDDTDARAPKWNVQTIKRDDIYIYRMPVDTLMNQLPEKPNPSIREYLANMVYVGVMAYLFNIDMDGIRDALSYHFGGKEKLINLNFGLVQMSYDWAAENLKKEDPYVCEPMEGTFPEGTLLTDGNSAGGLGAVFGGVQFVSWYPITPSSSLAESAQEYLGKYRVNEDGSHTYSVIQAEDELAAIGMAIGAGWAGARAMTGTSGPGISLMAEFVGLAYYAEIPVVIWDVQRVGPSTGLPTRTSQGDLLFAYTLGHGDTHHIVLLPKDPTECFEFGWRAFDYAEQFQTPVFVLSDLDIGMNMHITERFQYPDQPMNRGKVLDAKALSEFIEKHGKWGRYWDVDGDGIPYRTLPGTDHPMAAYFTRGTGHDEFAAYSEDAEVFERNLTRIARKFQTVRKSLPAPVLHSMDGASIGIISYGSNDPAIEETRDYLAAQDIKSDYLRIKALPLHADVEAFIQRFDRVYVVENNFDGQMTQIIRMELPHLAARLKKVCRLNGLPLDADWITEQIVKAEKES
ncbi:MAG: 2-oxoacid:acceptor oxidoreductase subunit alpha [Phototrophicales bacterium]|nr:MAG: 2-oxoacid:acceptor oxidoreductase subunit alpha [Phototrophicales bacterium]